MLFDYYVWLMLNMYFKGPAKMIARNDAMENWLKQFSLNGMKVPTICNPK